jgi:hypothetical protein
MTARPVVLAASALLLAGCAPAPQMPAPITPAEAKQRVDDNNRAWWNAMFPDEPMPVVEPIEYLKPNSRGTEITDCITKAGIGGLDPGPDGSFSPDGRELQDLANRVQFICSLQYPYDISEPSKMGYLSEEELAWNWAYNRERLVPCLRLLGYTINEPGGDYVEGSGNLWLPYFDMTPVPASDSEWASIDLRCPPSPVGPLYRPTGG